MRNVFPLSVEKTDGSADEVIRNQNATAQGKHAIIIDGLIFSQSTMVTAGLFTISIAGIDSGPRSISLSWQKDTIDLDIAEMLYKDMDWWLKYIILSKVF